MSKGPTVKPGHRIEHAKGIVCGGTFEASADAKTISRAAHFSGSAVPVTVRFSDGAQDPGIPDNSPDAAPRKLLFPSMTTLELMVGDVAIRETPFDLAYEGQLLSGILAEPIAADADLRLCAVLTNAGGVRRIGNHRVWVDVARRWAARGVPTLRMDVVGVGDSDGEEGLYREHDALQRREFAGQLLAAQDELERRGLPPSFIVGGLCSAAYWGLHADEIGFREFWSFVWTRRGDLQRFAYWLSSLPM